MAYKNTDLLFHRSVCQKSNGLSWFLCSMSAKPCEVVGRAAFFVETLERSLLDWFTLLAELISMQLWNWEPCFSAGCGWVSWSVSRGLLHTFVLGLYPHSEQWWVESFWCLSSFWSPFPPHLPWLLCSIPLILLPSLAAFQSPCNDTGIPGFSRIIYF